MKYCTLILLILSLATFAKVEISKNIFGSIALTSNDCNELESEIDSILEWKKISDGKSCRRPKIYGKSFASKRVGKVRCRATVTDCLPDHVKKYNGLNPETDGPNCWNLSLVMAGILPQLRYSTAEEMDFYMNPPLCRALQNGEDRRPGDIGAIRYGNGKEIHGFIRVTDTISYSKNGYSKLSPYEIQKQDEVYQAYGIDKMSSKCLDNRMDGRCYAGVEFYRCISMKEYLLQTKDQQESDPLEKAITTLDKLDCTTGEISFTGAEAVLDDTTIDTVQTLTEALTRSLTEELNSKKLEDLTEKEAFILGATKLRLKAIDTQLSIYQDDEEFEDDFQQLTTLRQLVRQSKRDLEEISK